MWLSKRGCSLRGWFSERGCSFREGGGGGCSVQSKRVVCCVVCRSPGYGLTLVSENTTGVLHSAELVLCSSSVGMVIRERVIFQRVVFREVDTKRLCVGVC